MDLQCLVIQIGFRFFRLGLAGEEFPRNVLEVGPEIARAFTSGKLVDSVADETAWDGIIHRLLGYLLAQATEILTRHSKVILIHTPDTPLTMRYAVINALLRTYGCVAVFPANGWLCALHCQALNTGLIVDVGHRCIRACAIAFGQLQTRSQCIATGRGAEAVHAYLARQLAVTAEEIENDIGLQESLFCRMPTSEGPEEEAWLWQALEIFFNDDYFEGDRTVPTLPELALSALEKCEIEVRPLVVQNIIIIGGCSDVIAFRERCALEISKLMRVDDELKCISRDRIGFGRLAFPSCEASFIGGSLIGAGGL